MQEYAYLCLKELESTFGSFLLCFFGLQTVTAVAFVYFTFITTTLRLGVGTTASLVWAGSNVIFCVLTVKRLVHVTSGSHRVAEELEKVSYRFLKVFLIVHT